MVRDLHGDQGAVATEDEEPETVAAEGAAADEVADQKPAETSQAAASSAADASPEDLVFKDDRSKPTTPRRKRNKKRGRS
jgi:hypothetical protein